MVTMTGMERPLAEGPDGTATPWGSRYDLLLAVIPLAFLVGGLLAATTGLSFRLTLPAAAAVGALAVVDGLFRNPPRRPRAGRRAA